MKRYNNLDNKTISFSIVILADNHNPSLLNHDFLLRNDIIEDEWAIDENVPFIITPIQTEFSYKTGVQFSLDQKRLIIKDIAPSGDIFPVPEIATKYIKTLPHVKYKEVGINFEKFCSFNSIDEARRYQIDKFLKKGDWFLDDKLKEVNVRFVYKFDDSICNVSLSSPQTGNKGGKQFTGLVLSANFHYDFDFIKEHYEKNKKIIDTISNWELDDKNFNLICNNIVGD